MGFHVQLFLLFSFRLFHLLCLSSDLSKFHLIHLLVLVWLDLDYHLDDVLVDVLVDGLIDVLVDGLVDGLVEVLVDLVTEN